MKTNLPTREEITQRAQKIWQDYGNPAGRDIEIWLEAERQLLGGSSEPNLESGAPESSRTVSEPPGAAALAEKVKAETVAESMVEFNISPATSDEDALKAALQKKEARAPKSPRKTAPKTTPPESGKPLWNRPHSS